jgi:translation initiation factor 1A
MLGNGRLEVHCFDGKKRMGHIRGKLRKKVWINVGDVVLCSLREFQDDKADVIQKYSPEETRALRKYKEIPDNYDQIADELGLTAGGGAPAEGDAEMEEVDGVVFDDESEEDIDAL